jgi:hypothetical protein
LILVHQGLVLSVSRYSYTQEFPGLVIFPLDDLVSTFHGQIIQWLCWFYGSIDESDNFFINLNHRLTSNSSRIFEPWEQIWVSNPVNESHNVWLFPVFEFFGGLFGIDLGDISGTHLIDINNGIGTCDLPWFT